MTAYRYTGGHPVPDGEGGMIRPQEVRERDTPPADWPWEVVPDDGPLPLDVPPGAPAGGGDDGPLPPGVPSSAVRPAAGRKAATDTSGTE